MNYDRQKAFPYPVLRPNSDDYRGVDFQTTVVFSVSRLEVRATLDFQISSQEIWDQITERNAQFVCLVSCRDTYHRTVVASYSVHAEAEFATSDLRGEVRVDPYVVARNRIVEFSSPDINPEFGDGPFDYGPGDILAQDEPQVFYIDREMFKPVTSVFELVKRDELTDREWRIGLEQDHVQIEVSPKVKETLDNARNSSRNRAILLNSIYFAAVMHTIEKLKVSAAEFEGRKWAEVISRQAHNSGCDVDSQDAYEIAQRLMHYPLVHLNPLFGDGA